MNKMKYTIYAFSVAFLLLFGACDRWLDIEPMDKMNEDKIFSSKEGFTKAINGVYLDMVDSKLYGKACEFLELLGQRYYVTTGHTYEKLVQYNYTEDKVRSIISGVWSKSYAEIANCNRILLHLEEKREMLGDADYNLLKGEALGLRALLHFDMLRLFAPAYDETDSGLYVPYYDEFLVTGKPLLKVSAFVEYLLNDLNSAELALKSDPIISGLSGNRNLRLNYYAVKLLQARVYQWRGTGASRNKAFQIATSVIDNVAFDRIFPWVEKDMALGNSAYASSPDRIFYSEILFGLQNNNRPKIYEDFFQSSLSDDKILVQVKTTVDDWYSYSGDYRNAKMWMSVVKNSKDMKVLQKYEEIKDTKLTLRTVTQSVLRRGEFYLIAADCASSDAVACEYLNKLQRARGYQNSDLTKVGSDIQSAIRAEYNREFIGEGQYFFYLKMKKVLLLDKGNGEGSFTMTDAQYVLPLPENETNSR